jgi:acetyltransferase
MATDPDVQSILLYIESLTAIRKFMSAARAASRLKPIVILKAGTSPAGARAASSHTGAMAGEDAVYDAAFRRAGAVRVHSIRDFFDCAELLAKQPRPKGSRVTVITNSGGPGVMAADAIAEYGLQVSPLSKETLSSLNQVLPPQWSRGNPIDILGDATAKRYAKVVECCIEARETDGLLVILNPQAMTDPAEVASALAQAVGEKPYPVFTSWMGGRDVEKGIEILNQAGIPTYDTPEDAIRAFMYLHQYAQNLQMLEEIPPKLSRDLRIDPSKAQELIELGLSRQSGLLSETESKALLAAYDIPVNEMEKASTEEESVRLANQMGFPLVMKIDSLDISHKTEADGVQLDLRSEEDVRKAYKRIMEGARNYDPDATVQGVTLQPMVSRPDVEILLGAKRDANFGPVVLFGTGGIYAEVFQDRSLALPPLNRSLARRLMEDTKVFRLLQGYRSRRPVDMEQLEKMIIGLSQLLIDFPQISELDMNPVIVKDGKPFAADARIFLMVSETPSPRHLVISPYPSRYEDSGVSADGMRLLIRPVKPEDAPLLVDLFNRLSRTSIYYRFFSPMKSLSQHMIARFTQIDYDREVALVALDEESPQDTLLGSARIIGHPDGKRGEFAVVVGDPWQGKGIGANLLRRCLRIMKDRGMETVWGTALRENRQMIALARKLGFNVSSIPGTSEYELSLDLTAFEDMEEAGAPDTEMR